MEYDSYDDHADRWFDSHGNMDGFDEAYERFVEEIHDDEADHSPDSWLAEYFEDLGYRDEDWPWDVGDTPE